MARRVPRFGHDLPLQAISGQIGKGGDQLMPVFLTPKRLDGIGEKLEKHRSRDLVGRRDKIKPYPDIFMAALERLKGIDPSDIIVVGDTPYDAEAAAKAGLRTIGMLCGGFPEDGLRAAGCVAIYPDPADLLAQNEQSPLAQRA